MELCTIIKLHQIAGKESWLYGAIKSIVWMLHDPGIWETFAPHAKQLQKTLRKVKASHMLKVRNMCELHNHAKRQSSILRDMGWKKVEMNEGETHFVHHVCQCDECTEVFNTEAALAVHQQRKHGRRIAMRRFAVDAACRACERFFHIRPRLLRHLHMGTTDCWVWHLRRYILMSTEKAQELDQEDKRKGVAMHQKGFVGPEGDKILRAYKQQELAEILCLCSEGAPNRANRIGRMEANRIATLAKGAESSQ